MNGKGRNGEAEEGKSDQEEKTVCVVGGCAEGQGRK